MFVAERIVDCTTISSSAFGAEVLHSLKWPVDGLRRVGGVVDQPVEPCQGGPDENFERGCRITLHLVHTSMREYRSASEEEKRALATCVI